MLLLNDFVKIKVMILTIRKDTFDSSHGLLLKAGKQLLSRRGVINRRGRHDDRKKQAHAVHDNMAFAAIHILGVVTATLLAARGRIDRLTIDTGRRARLVRLLRGAYFLTQRIVYFVEGAVVAPFIEVLPDRAFGRKIFGQIPPLTTGA